jgi:putative FmdB family regulatory protein
VALYEYRCDKDGLFEVTRRLGTAPESVPCSVCGNEARRVFSAPMLRCGSRPALFAAIEHAQKSRYEPEVVTSVPSAGARRRTPVVLPLTPTLAGLPRP